MTDTKDILILAALFLPLFGLAFAVCIDSYISRKRKVILLIIAAAVAGLILQNYLEYRLVTGTPRIALRTCVAIAGYCIRPVILVLFFHIVSPRRDYVSAWVLAGLNAAIYATALFSPLSFRITEDNFYIGGPLRYFCLYVSLVLLAYLLYLTVHEYRSDQKWELIIPLVIVVLIGVSVALDSNSSKVDQPVEYLTVAVVTSCVFYYIWLHLQFVREHEEDLKARQRIRIMMSQIQPHFLYNTLSTVQALCHTDPEKAADITGQFSLFLRQNLASLNQPGLIPFWKELEHVQSYVKIEETRFPNIRVEYGIGDGEFQLPPLTLQPLVENAIRYGVRIREKGIVRITTARQAGWHEIVIRDNGTGFDVQKLEKMDESHIGIRNVRERIESMCGGTLTIESAADAGTTVTIRIPAAEEMQT